MADRRKQIAEVIKKANLPQLASIMSGLSEDGRKIIISGLNDKLTEGEKRRLMNMIKDKVAVADVATRDWLVKGISGSYVAGYNGSNEFLRKFGLSVGGAKINVELLRTLPAMKPHLEAVNALIGNAYLDFGNSMTGYVKGAERILNDALRRQVRAEIALGRLEGSSVREIKNTVKEIFSNQGFTVLLDKGGRQWELGDYSEMISRTHLLKANNEAVINRASDFGIDIVEVSSHGATDELCGFQEGQIYSISGKSKEYPSMGANEPPFHPNCKHTLLLRPDLSPDFTIDDNAV